MHLVGILSSRFAHDARSQEHKAWGGMYCAKCHRKGWLCTVTEQPTSASHHYIRNYQRNKKMVPCHHGMARLQVADGGTVSNMEGSFEYIE